MIIIRLIPLPVPTIQPEEDGLREVAGLMVGVHMGQSAVDCPK